MLCLAAVVAPFWVEAQGSFQDLDFEQASVVPAYPGSPFIWTADAFPGWTVYANGTPQSSVSYGQIYSPAVAGLLDSHVPGGQPPFFNVTFGAVLAGSGLGGPASIGQSGVIPAGAETLLFLGSPFSVFFAGHALPLQALGDGFGVNITAYAGQYGQLLFQARAGGAYYLDDISFSTQAIPEPAPVSVLALGGLVLSLRRRRRRAFGRGLGPMAFGNPTGLLPRRDSAKITQRDNAGIG